MNMKLFIMSAYTLGLAEIAVAGDGGALLTYGPLGIITAWLMYRDEKRATAFRDSETRNAQHHHDILHRIDGLTKALLVEKIESDATSDYVRKYASETIARIDARAQRADNLKSS